MNRKQTFSEALEIHSSLVDLADEFDELLVESVWTALTNRRVGKYAAEVAEAALSTAPHRFILLFPMNSGAAAVPATRMICEAVKNLDVKCQRREIKVACRVAWEKFSKWAAVASRVQEGFGCGAGDSWKVMSDIGERKLSDKTMGALVE